MQRKLKCVQCVCSQCATYPLFTNIDLRFQIERNVAYEKTTVELSKWDSVVHSNRKVRIVFRNLTQFVLVFHFLFFFEFCPLVLAVVCHNALVCSSVCKEEVYFYIAHVSSQLDHSKCCTLHPLGRPVHCDTKLTSLGSILATQQLRAKTIHSRFNHRL